jgi:hypothetical protein
MEASKSTLSEDSEAIAETELFDNTPIPGENQDVDAGCHRDGDAENPFVPAPSVVAAKAALVDLTAILNPKRKSGIGHNPFDGDNLLQHRLEMMKMFLWKFVDKKEWAKASEEAAYSFQRVVLPQLKLKAGY